MAEADPNDEIPTFTSAVTVEYVQHSGDDRAIARAARVSVVGAMDPVDDSETAVNGLLRYLTRHKHGSPFECGSLTVRVHAPIFVFREWHRHRAGWSYSEESGRYRHLRPVFWVPASARPVVEPAGFKPARPRLEASPPMAAVAAGCLRDAYREAWVRYREQLDYGVAREVARACLPVGLYSSMYATANPRAIMHFLSLRTHDEAANHPSHPQAEIEQAARQLEAVFRDRWPLTWAAWHDGGREAP